jgi:hypothetical protein
MFLLLKELKILEHSKATQMQLRVKFPANISLTVDINISQTNMAGN